MKYLLYLKKCLVEYKKMVNHKRFNVLRNGDMWVLCERVRISSNEVSHNKLCQSDSLGEINNYLKDKLNAKRYYRRRGQWIVEFDEVNG